MNSRDSLLRKVIGGKYHIEALIGHGGCGEVYRATQFPVERAVAIKVIRPSSDVELGPVRQRFFLEARVLAKLTDPSTVRLFDYGEEGDGLLYMVQEFVEGHTLDVVLRREGRLAPHRVVSIGAQLLHSLAEAHGFDIVHRDIKPTNIMVTADGLVKITDFGIARIRSSELKTMTGIVLGSPRYMSPEQVTGAPLDQRTDVFSLGVVLYELLTGRPPFQADSVQGIMFQALNSQPVPPSRINPAIPRILDFVVAKAIAKDANFRYATAAAFAADLRASIGSAVTTTLVATSGNASGTGAAPPTPLHARPDESAGGAAGATLSGAFDSRTATLRLQRLAAGQAAPEGTVTLLAPSASPVTERQPRAPIRRLASVLVAASGRRAFWLWLAAAATFAGAVHLFTR